MDFGGSIYGYTGILVSVKVGVHIYSLHAPKPYADYQAPPVSLDCIGVFWSSV